ncbi:hypothetical protein LO771_02930 [Streptacidiphilus sp. ASG 303]|uniref:hypothetical protein n=1 Tax=Streptacidiphilus sp. ASG 303 TaxID=2896847 RepID=UPI001E407060|nr:hypothetical protein [Streptacidiphilus sp. ASG 303]MCD0481388.1 hypothetical protein [Streptacidiphilus sp. ASG 303]
MGGTLAADLVVIGAECGGERALAGTADAGRGAGLLAGALHGAWYDGVPGPGRTAVVSPDAGANAMLTAVQEAAGREGRFLVVCLLGRLVADPRQRRLALVTAGSTRDNAYRRGLAWDWVVSAMVHGGHRETLLLVDAVADRDTWEALDRGDGGPAELLDHSRVPLWGSVAPWAAPRRGRGPVPPGADGSFADAVARVVRQGVPGLPGAVSPADLHPAVRTRLGARERAEARLLAPAPGGRLLLRNPAALRGMLSQSSLSGELLALLDRKDSPSRPPSA